MADVGKADLALAQFDKQMRDSIIYMQGMQALQEFASSNNPAQLQGVWSYFSPAPVGIRPRSDGKYDYYYNGQLSREGMSKQDIQAMAQQAMFQSARDAIAKSAALENELALKSKYGDARINAMKDIWLAVINGQVKIAEERAKASQGKLTVDTASGGAYFQSPEGALFYLSKSGIIDLPGGGKVQPIGAQPIAIPGR